MGREPDSNNKAQEQIARRRLTRLLDALPVFTGFCTPDGHLLQTRPPAKETFLWALPAFSYSHDSITQIVECCERAAGGERVQVERDYRAGDDSESLRRGLLTLSPLETEEGLIDEIGVSLIDAEDHGLSPPDPRAKSRLEAANARIGNILSLAQTVVETLASRPAHRVAPDRRDHIVERLDVLGRVIDPLSDLDRGTMPLREAVALALGGPAEMPRDRLSLDLGPANLSLDVVPLFTLMVSELALNARQHGAWRTPDAGRVSVQSETLDTPRGRVLRLHWVEDATSEVAAILSRGFGLTLVQRLFPQLTGGTATLLDNADGVSWTLELPAASGSETRAAVPAAFGGGFDGGFGDDGNGAA